MPLMVGHRTMGSTLAFMGDLAGAKVHYNEALGLYRAAEHRRLMTRFGQDLRVTCLAFRSMLLWLLGYPEAALKGADCALWEARQTEHAATLMFTLNFPILVNTYCGNYDAANERLKELVLLAEEKRAPFRTAEGVMRQGYILTLTGEAAKAVEMVTSGIELWRSAGSTIFTPEHEFMLAIAHANSGQFDDAWRCIGKSHDGNARNQGKMVRGRGSSRCRRDRAQVTAAGRGESASIFRACPDRCASAAGKVVGIARGHEPGAAFERSGKTAIGT